MTRVSAPLNAAFRLFGGGYGVKRLTALLEDARRANKFHYTQDETWPLLCTGWPVLQNIRSKKSGQARKNVSSLVGETALQEKHPL